MPDSRSLASPGDSMRVALLGYRFRPFFLAAGVAATLLVPWRAASLVWGIPLGTDWPAACGMATRSYSGSSWRRSRDSCSPRYPPGPARGALRAGRSLTLDGCVRDFPGRMRSDPALAASRRQSGLTSDVWQLQWISRSLRMVPSASMRRSLRGIWDSSPTRCWSNCAPGALQPDASRASGKTPGGFA